MSNFGESGDIKINFNFKRMGEAVRLAVYDTMKKNIAPHAMREAIRNAPVSPTVAQLSATLKRKKRTSRRLMPHGLEKSIMSAVEMRGDSFPDVAVFVPSNSPAGKYARYIHDEKGKKWWKRGIGTQRKGVRADDKFIARAIADNDRKYFAAIGKAVGTAIQKNK